MLAYVPPISTQMAKKATSMTWGCANLKWIFPNDLIWCDRSRVRNSKVWVPVCISKPSVDFQICSKITPKIWSHFSFYASTYIPKVFGYWMAAMSSYDKCGEFPPVDKSWLELLFLRRKQMAVCMLGTVTPPDVVVDWPPGISMGVSGSHPMRYKVNRSSAVNWKLEFFEENCYSLQKSSFLICAFL